MQAKNEVIKREWLLKLFFKRQRVKISLQPRAACLARPVAICVLISSRLRGKVWWAWFCVCVRVSRESKDSPLHGSGLLGWVFN